MTSPGTPLSEHANCEPDTDRLLAALSSVAGRTKRPHPPSVVQFAVDPPPPVMDVPIGTVTENVLAYILGYLIAKSDDRHTFPKCKAALCSGNTTVLKDREALIGLKSYTGQRSIDVGSLKVPSDQMYQLVAVAYETVQAQVMSTIYGQGVMAVFNGLHREHSALRDADEVHVPERSSPADDADFSAYAAARHVQGHHCGWGQRGKQVQQKTRKAVW